MLIFSGITTCPKTNPYAGDMKEKRKETAEANGTNIYHFPSPIVEGYIIKTGELEKIFYLNSFYQLLSRF